MDNSARFVHNQNYESCFLRLPVKEGNRDDERVVALACTNPNSTRSLADASQYVKWI
jgi:hypothetical protein